MHHEALEEAVPGNFEFFKLVQPISNQYFIY
jgi:hypothetical protein